MATITQSVPGWNGGANTVAELAGDGYYTFQVGQRTGICVGLSKTVCGGFYEQIEHAFLIQGNSVAIYESGVLKSGPVVRVVDGKTFKIDRTNGVVTYSLDNVLLYTSTQSSMGTVWLDAAFYAMGDEIIDATLTDTDVPYTDPTDPEDPDASRGDSAIRFQAFGIDDVESIGFGAMGFTGTGTITDAVIGDGRFGFFAAVGGVDFGLVRFGFTGSAISRVTMDTSYAQTFFRYNTWAEATTDYAGTGDGQWAYSAFASDTEGAFGFGRVRYHNEGSLADTPAALLWAVLDQILGVRLSPRIVEFPSFHRLLLSGGVDWDTDDLRLLCMDGDYRYDVAHEIYADVIDHEISSDLYPTGGFLLPNRVVGTTYLAASDLNLTGMSGSSNGFLLYKNATVDGLVQPLLAYLRFATNQSITLNSSGRLRLTWTPPGLFVFN
jgi:hypothetical protein